VSDKQWQHLVILTHDYRRAMIMQKFMITGGSYQPSFKKEKINIGSIKTAQGTKT
jgi:hypothetical protein